MPNTDFDNARSATEELFDNSQLSLEDAAAATSEEENTEVSETQTEETTEVPEPPATSTQEQATQDEATLSEAVETADVAAQVAADKDAQLQQALQQIQFLQNQNTQMQGTIEELSKQNEQQVVEEALEPPQIDFNALAFADEETVKAAQAKYAADMAEYNRKAFMKEFAPVIEQANEAKYAKEKSEAISALSKIPELNGIENMMPQLDKIIANNAWLSSDNMSMEERYINAFAIALGVNAMNKPPEQPKELSPEEMMQLYNNNPAFQELVEKQRLEQIKQSQQVPPFSASSGAVNAALNIKEEPKGWDEASKRTVADFEARFGSR